jgi:hypothetical protein
MSRIAVFEGFGRRHRRKARKGFGKRPASRKAKSTKKKTSRCLPPAPSGSHWRTRKTRNDAGKKGGRTPAQKLFARSAHYCKSQGKSKNKSTFNACIKRFMKDNYKAA